MSLTALGIDPSSKKIATAGLDEDGNITTRLLPVPAALRGAQRLAYIRSALSVQLSQFRDVAVIVVEIPWAHPRPSFVLLSIAGVILEAAQSTHPDVEVLGATTGEWKLATVGKGNASKADVLGHAHGRGYFGEDQDIADALAMAEMGWGRWHGAVRAA